MDFLRPKTLDEALALKAARPDAVPVAGGTDVMVELNFDRRRPAALLDLNGLAELARWSTVDPDRPAPETRETSARPAPETPDRPGADTPDRLGAVNSGPFASETSGRLAGGGTRVRLGASVPYTRVIDELGDLLPALAMASRTVGSPQIRNRGTVGGNLGAASPAGDTHPVLLVTGAEVEVSSVRGTRLIPADEFYLGVKRNALAEDELITAVHLPAATGPQQFAKVGTRNAMVIAVCSFAIALAPGQVRAAIGSAAPTPRRAREAEEFLSAELPWDSSAPLPDSIKHRFGELVASAAAPIDDVRGTAAYRKHALSVLARRTLGWAWEDLLGRARVCA